MGSIMLKRLILVSFLCALTLAGARASERITRFVSDVDVQRNGDLLVTETIQVRAEGAAIRHGILRDFPTTYRAKDGTRVVVGFDVLEVRRDGAPEPYATERVGNGVRIRIGDAKRYLNGGPHEYRIKYRTTRQIGFFKDFDELYWNATGNGWTFPIDEAEARITLPERVAFKQTALYTGPQGARGKDAAIVEQQPGRIVFRTTKGLPYRNGLTVAAAWPKGVVAPPTQLQKLQSLFADRPGASSAIFGGGLVILFYLTAWLLVGRDPRGGAVIPLFAPPEGMSAAAVRYVDTMTYDNRCFAAAIVGLGVNGHLKLTSTDDNGEIKHVKSDQPLDAAEKAVEHGLFKAQPAVKLDRSDADVINDAKMELWRTLSKTYAGKLFNNNALWSYGGFFASAAVVALIGHAFVSNYGNGGPGMAAGMVVPLIPIMIGAVLVRGGWRRGGLGGALRMLGGLILACLFMALGVFLAWAKAPNMQAVFPAFAAFALAPFAVLGFHWLQAPNKLGRQIMDQIEGFKLYLGVAEQDRLNFDNPPKETPELFERFLPYAIALDVQNAWAKRFAGVLAAAAASGAAVATWCGDRRWRDDPESFVDSLSSDLSTTIESASSRARLERRRQRRRQQRLLGRRLVRRRRWRRRRFGLVKRCALPQRREGERATCPVASAQHDHVRPRVRSARQHDEAGGIVGLVGQRIVRHDQRGAGDQQLRDPLHRLGRQRDAVERLARARSGGRRRRLCLVVVAAAAMPPLGAAVVAIAARDRHHRPAHRLAAFGRPHVGVTHGCRSAGPARRWSPACRTARRSPGARTPCAACG